MVGFLCLGLVLYLPLAFTLPMGSTDGAAGDLTGAMVALIILFNEFAWILQYSSIGQLSDYCRRQGV